MNLKEHNALEVGILCEMCGDNQGEALRLIEWYGEELSQVVEEYGDKSMDVLVSTFKDRIDAKFNGDTV